MVHDALKTFRKAQSFKPCYRIHKLQIPLILGFLLAVISIAFSDSAISILWEKEIAQAGRAVNPLTVKVDEETNTIRVIGVSYIYRSKETPRLKDPNLFEYRFNLNDHTSQMKTLLTMDANDITLAFPQAGVLDSQIIKGNIVILREQHKSHNLQDLTIGSNWQVKVREIPGLTRSSVSTHGACRNLSGAVFLCGNSGYIRKVDCDGKVAWDTNYKSDKGEDGTLGVAYSESENMLVAFGMSFEPDTKFTSKDSSLWLANLDSEGNFKTKAEFEGIADFGKTPTFCLNTSEHPVVLYDNNTTKRAANQMMQKYTLYVSSFSKDLSTNEWTKQIFDGKDLLISRMFLMPFGEDSVLAVFDSMTKESTNSGNLHFYILNNNGNIVNQADFQDIEDSCSSVTVFDDKMLLVMVQGHLFKDAKAKLVCCNIKP